jgi:hypothetical protein
LSCGATLIVEQLLDKDAKLLAEKARDMALAGDTIALKLCLERLCPPRRSRPVTLDLPAIETLGDAFVGVLCADRSVFRSRRPSPRLAPGASNGPGPPN